MSKLNSRLAKLEATAKAKIANPVRSVKDNEAEVRKLLLRLADYDAPNELIDEVEQAIIQLIRHSSLVTFSNGYLKGAQKATTDFHKLAEEVIDE